MMGATLTPEPTNPVKHHRHARHVLPDGELKPLFRGHLHQWAAVSAAAASIVLVVFASPGLPRFSAVVYGICLTGMLSTSALYHRVKWGAVAHERMRKADHSGIFLCIAGTYTPIALVGVDGWQRIAIIIASWTIAVAGITFEWMPVKPPRGYVTGVYLSMGWIAIIALPAMIREMSASSLFLILAGGLVYSGGAFIHAFQRPNPWPQTFGYHEIWHVFVVVAAAAHFLAVWYIIPHTY
jgi:hemolysin III